MDGIVAMEGNGPRSGNAKKMNLILISTDPVALDATVCRIINLDPKLVPTVLYAKEAGLGTYEESEIELVGDPIDRFIDPSFVVKRESIEPYTPGKAIQILRNTLVAKPKINSSKCKKCGVCIKMCPVNPKALSWSGVQNKTLPGYTYKNCIRCYCCQELCPESAIHLKTPVIRKVLSTVFPKFK